MGYKENFSAYSLGGNCPKKIWKLAGLLLHFWLKIKFFCPKSISFLGRSDLLVSRGGICLLPQEGKRIPFGTNAL